MAKKKQEGPSKSHVIREILQENPQLSAKEVIAALAGKGIKATENLVYFVKGRMKGQKSRRQKAQKMVDKVSVTTGKEDAVKTILKVKGWANEVGGLRRLKALVDAMSE